MADRIRRCPKRHTGIRRAAAHQDAGPTAANVASPRAILDVGFHVRFVRCEVCALGYPFLVCRRSVFGASMSVELGKSFAEAWWIRAGPLWHTLHPTHYYKIDWGRTDPCGGDPRRTPCR